LKILPIGNRTVLRDSRVLAVVEKWSKQVENENVTADGNSKTSVVVDQETDVTDSTKQSERGFAEVITIANDSDVSTAVAVDNPPDDERRKAVDSSSSNKNENASPEPQHIVAAENTEKPGTVEISEDSESCQLHSASDSPCDPPGSSAGSVPHKKRHLLITTDTASSSDGELTKTEETGSQDDEGN
jgi:hypothetical protein